MVQQEFNLFMREALERDFAIVSGPGREELLTKLAEAINHMISTDFPALISILYRLDIDEHLLKRKVQEQPETDAGVIIAALIEQRQYQKWKTRGEFKRNSDIPDDEKW